MPELPEVETIRRGLEGFILGKKIATIKILDSKLKPALKSYQSLKGDRIKKIDRRAKLLIFSFKNSSLFLLIHLKMTGQLIYWPSGSNKFIIGGHLDSGPEQVFKHQRFQIIFSSGDLLALNDSRRFAYLKLVSASELEKIKKKFGLEPLETMKFQDFLNLSEKHKRKNVKAFLLDQSLISGIGNIYADEILFASAVLPQRKIESLSLIEKKMIFSNISKILKKAVMAKGTTFSNYLDSQGEKGNYQKYLKVYGRDGQTCKKCSNLIQKDRVVGRGTHYCSFCQK